MSNRNLNYQRKRNDAIILRKLQAEGIDADIPDGWDEACPFEIKQTEPGIISSQRGGGTYLAIPILVTTRWRAISRDCEIWSDWDDSIQLPGIISKRSGRYCFGPFDYAVREVLNDRLESHLRLNFTGDMVEGVILCSAMPIPNDYNVRQPATTYVRLTDTLGRAVEQAVKCIIEMRPAKRFEPELDQSLSAPTNRNCPSAFGDVKNISRSRKRARTATS